MENSDVYKGIADVLDLVMRSSWDFSLNPVRIIRNGNATIVMWADGTKTVVKKSADDPEDDYAAFTAALAKKVYRNNSHFKKMLKERNVEQKPSKKQQKREAEEAERIMGIVERAVAEKYAKNDD